MILVQLNQENFEYDIHSLVKAFYPSEDVTVSTGQKEGLDLEPVLRILVEYGPDKIHIALEGSCGQYPPGHLQSGVDQYPSGHLQSGMDQHPSGHLQSGPGQQRFEKVFAADEADRKNTKNLLKQNLYEMLAAYTGRTLPWGTLTGIRPSKIPMTMLEEGRTPAEITDYMQKTYSASGEKIALSIEIAQREARLLHRLDVENGYSLYIGIPFCPSTCLYCSFTSFPISRWKKQIHTYLHALEQELDFTAQQFAGRYLNTIYIGGGTPTTLEPQQMEWLLSALEHKLDLSRLMEFTVEAGRPDSITRQKLEVLRAHGISRISINPQTMKQKTLDLIGRQHTVEQTADSFHLARSMGFDNINMDLIMGLPEESLEDVINTLEQIRELAPDSVTVHSLALKRAARLQMFKEDYAGLKMVNTQEHLDAASDACAKMGMVPYYMYRQKNMAGNFENVGYAKEGKAGIYNVLMMEEVQSIVACGAGSISKRVYPDGHIERCENVKDISQYISRIGEMLERKRALFQKKDWKRC